MSYDAAGVPLVKTEPLDMVEVPVYGAGKLGTFYPGQDGSMAYEITDHLGNVRALLRDNITAYTATMEDDGTVEITNPREQEKMFFMNLEETEVDDPNMNHTSAGATSVATPSRSAYLFWQDGITGMEAVDKAIGPAIILNVNAGDEVELETWVRFGNKTTYTRDVDLLFLSSLLGSDIAGTPGFDGVTPTQVATGFNTGLGSFGFGNDGDDATRPFAYLNYVLFREDLTVVDAGWRRVPLEAGFDPGEEALPGMHQRVYFEQPVVPQESGYLYVWVSNESEDTEVWFDDLKVTHTGTFVAQATDYGAWGDVLREQRTDERKYRFGYQGQFSERDLETGWNHFELREYDAVVGRWTAPDPNRQYPSPYVAMGNNPVNRTDPDGGCDGPDCPPKPTFVSGDCMCSSYDENFNPITFIPENAPLPVGFQAMDPLSGAWDFITTGSLVGMRRFNGQEVNWDGLIASEVKLIEATVPEWLTPGGGGGGINIIKGLQRGLRNPALVKDLAAAMKNGTYEFNALRGIIAGYKDAKGIYYVSEGHHRMAAAFKVFRETGNGAPIKQLLQNGRWTEVATAPAGARPLPSTSWWGSFRNWIGF